MILGFLAGSVFFYFFYRHVFVLFFGIPAGILFCRWQMKELAKRRQRILVCQFRDWITAVAANLQAGYSVENAFVKSGRDLDSLYDEKTDIQREICYMEHLLNNNVTLERILEDFGNRSGVTEIENFVEIFAAGKRSSGNFRDIISFCCEVISAGIDTEKEIRTMLHGKVMEQRVMCVVPFIIMLYISCTSPGYFDPLYQSMAGRIIMTVCLAVYVTSVAVSRRIVSIEV
ncbi:MAG: type II secretion system F family protein [Lachnospiraceae bacterium]